MSAKIYQPQDRQGNDLFPQTLTSAVFDPETGASIKAIVEAAVRDLLGKMGDLSDLQTAIKSSLVDAINEARQTGGGGGGGGSVVVVDNLNSDSATAALSANQGKVLKEMIPAAVTEAIVSGWGFTKNTGTYSKPSGGIPKSDLASAVQTSLGKADSALQSESEPAFNASAAKNITSENISSWNNKGSYSKPSGGIPKTDLAQAVQDSLGKADSALQSVPATYRTAADQDTIDAGKAAKIRKGLAYPDSGFVAGIFYSLGSISGSHSWALQASTDEYAEYMISFTAGSPAPTISWPAGISWAGGSAPEIKAGKSYQISILDNLAIAAEF